MRFRKPDSHRQRKPIMEIEFTEEGLTSYAGLELVRSFLSRLGFFLSLRKVEERIGFHGDTPFRSMILLILGLLLVGGRRLSHVAHLEHDPVVLRFAGLDRVPSRATVGRFLKQFNSKNWSALDRLNVDALRPSIALFRRRSLTIDLDGSVLTKTQATIRFKPTSQRRRRFWLTGTAQETSMTREEQHVSSVSRATFSGKSWGTRGAKSGAPMQPFFNEKSWKCTIVTDCGMRPKCRSFLGWG